MRLGITGHRGLSAAIEETVRAVLAFGGRIEAVVPAGGLSCRASGGAPHHV